MRPESPVVQYTRDIGVDASYSKIFQTKRQRVPRLHPKIRGYTDAAALSPGEAWTGKEKTMDKLEDDDIMALPLSSGDEEEGKAREIDTLDESRANIPSTSKRKAQNTEDTPTSRKRVKKDVKPTRTSKRVVQQSNIELETPPEPSSSAQELPDFMSQSSQSKKPKNKYGRVNSFNRPSSQDGFADPGNLPTTPRKPRTTSFQAPDSLPSTRKRTPNQKIKGIEIPLSAEKPKESVTKFKMPEELGLPAPSSTSTELSHILDDDVSSELTSRKRTSSTSSLSSVDSIASYELSQKQKDSIQNGAAPEAPIPAGCIQCPLCQKIIDLTQTPSKLDPTNLTLRKQQSFCQTHRVNDARAEWREKGYPTIDWTSLEKKRIPKYIPHLNQVLYRKAPSFYLENLESELKAAKGNLSKIRKYLGSDIVDVVKTGYYGPKGAKVMGNKITSEMAKTLQQMLKAHKTVRSVGVSGFVAAVLLPELLQQIVMDDMDIDNGDEARRLISETTEVGMLLWPDDDHVAGEGDE